MDNTATELKKRADRLFSQRQPLDSLNQEIALNFYAAQASFTADMVIGQDINAHQTHSYPEMVRDNLGIAFNMMLRPADRPWLSASVDDDVDEDQEAALWLGFVDKILTRQLSNRLTRFARTASMVDQDLAAFGQGVMSCRYNRARTGLLFQYHHQKDVVWTSDGEGGIGQTYRKSRVPVCEPARQWGLKNLPQAWQALCANNDQAPVTVYHGVMKADEYDSGRKIKNAYVSTYFADTGDILDDKGDEVNEYIIPRWKLWAGSQYAFSPAAMIALPQARLIQRMFLTIIESAEKAVDPPMIATQDVVKSEVDLGSGSVTWIDREYDERFGAALRPVEFGKNPQMGIELLDKQLELLSRTFYLDKIATPAQAGAQPKTAYEVSQQVQEYVRNALPLFQPLEDEYNSQMLDTVATRLMVMNAFGTRDEIPQILQGKKVTWKFKNPLSEGVERKKVVDLQEVLQLIGAAAQVDPMVLHQVDIKGMFRDAAQKGVGIDPKRMIDPQVAAQAEAAAQQGAQDQQQLNTAGQVANIAGQGAMAGKGVAELIKAVGASGGAIG